MKQNIKIKKPFYKKWWFWILAIIIGSSISGSYGNKDKQIQDTTNKSVIKQNKDKKNDLTSFDKELLKKNYKNFNNEERTQFAEIEEKYNEMSNVEKEKMKTDFERLLKERDIQVAECEKKEKEKTIARENIVGTSNENFKDLSNQKPRKVRNDATGNWRITTLSESCNIEAYALSYYKENFEEDKEIHAIVNFSTNTTTRIADMGNFIDVTILEYVKKEEHDAKKLFGGMQLGEYWIYKDNGDIKKIK